MSFLPLQLLRNIGSVVGFIAYKFSTRSSNRLRANLLATGMCNEANLEKFARQTAKELGKTLIESIAVVWYRTPTQCSKLVTQGLNFEQMMKATKLGPVLYFTPHIGNFEIGAKSTASILPQRIFNILYKPAKDPVFNTIMLKGRSAVNIKPHPITRRGISSFIRALKEGGLVGLLPDNVASSGDGVWVNFFGNKVFATTLAAKLTLLPHVKTFFVYTLRTNNGFTMNYLPFEPKGTDIASIVQDLYVMLETIVQKAPTQYYWSYDRFRKPSHAPEIK